MKVSLRIKFPKLIVSYVYADISVNGLRLKYSLKMSVPVKCFDASKQRLVGEEHLETNELLNQHESSIFRVIRELQMVNKLNKEELKSRLDDVIRLEKEEVAITELVAYAKMYKKRVGRVRKIRTLKNYQSTIARLEAYELKIGRKLTFNDINLDFYHSLMNYCKVELEQSTNTFGSYIKHIKTWMNAATEEGLNSNMMFRSRSFITTEETADSTYLTQDELEQLKQLDLKGNHLEKVRDIFVVACYTGLRIGDYHKVCFDNMINDNTMLKVCTEKTSKNVIIPIHPFVYKTLERYRGVLPMLSHQKFNKYIKDVIALAEIDKYITSHCARRSFATNAFKSGVPSISIMQITGHTTEKNFLKYIRITKEENAIMISAHSFFNSQAH